MSIQFGPEWQEFDRRLARTPQQQEADVRRVMQASLLLIERDARRMAPQDTRRLAGSINSQINGTWPQLVGQVGPGVRYGIVMERGRRVGARMPPVNALIGWVRRHWRPGFIGPIPRGQLRPRRAAPRNVTETQIRSRAFALARAIQRRGIQARPYLVPAYERNRMQIQQAFARIGFRTVAFLTGGPSASPL